MTALAANAAVESQGAGGERELDMGVDIIYRGALVMISKNAANGYAVPCAEDTTRGEFVGVATEKADNSGGSAGDITCEVATRGRFLLTLDTSEAQTDVGAPVYAVDDATVSLTANDGGTGLRAVVGRITKLETATTAWVELDPNAIDP